MLIKTGKITSKARLTDNKIKKNGRTKTTATK